MEENIIILGAGASADSGAPLMSNFLDKAEDLLSSNIDPRTKECITKVFHLLDEMQKVHSKSRLDLNNIETVFGAIEMAQIIKRLGNINPSEIPDYRRAIVKLIVRTIEQSMNFEYENSFIYAPGSYKSLMAYISKEKEPFRTIISFNYDLGIDTAVHRAGYKVRYGFEEASPETNAFNVLKLHGSINWISSQDDKTIYPYYPEWYLNDFSMSGSQSVKGKTKFVITNNLQLINQHNPIISNIKYEPVIVPPTWNKTGYHGTLSNIWGKAAEKLSQAKRIFVFGYSLPESDSFFRYLYALGTLSSTRIRNIVVVNPDPLGGDVDNRFKQLLGESIRSRYQYIPDTFNHAPEIITKALMGAGSGLKM